MLGNKTLPLLGEGIGMEGFAILFEEDVSQILECRVIFYYIIVNSLDVT